LDEARPDEKRPSPIAADARAHTVEKPPAVPGGSLPGDDEIPNKRRSHRLGPRLSLAQNAHHGLAPTKSFHASDLPKSPELRAQDAEKLTTNRGRPVIIRWLVQPRLAFEASLEALPFPLGFLFLLVGNIVI